MIASAPRRPVMRYHGGKWRLAPWVISHFPPHRVYVEPYGGAASVILRKARSPVEVYNDLDEGVVNLFRVLRDPVKAEQLAESLALTPWSRVEWIASYEDRPCDSDVERARKIVVRAQMAHGGTWQRGHRTGFRSRVWAQRRNCSISWAEFPDEVLVLAERFTAVVIENRPALEVIEQQDHKETLFYLDPPYPLDTRTGIRWPSDVGRAYVHEMTDDDHRALAAALHSIEGMAIISSYPSPLYDELYGGWICARRTGVLADAGARREECLWMSPRCRSQFLF